MEWSTIPADDVGLHVLGCRVDTIPAFCPGLIYIFEKGNTEGMTSLEVRCLWMYVLFYVYVGIVFLFFRFHLVY